MKFYRKLLSTILALALCVTLVGTAIADSNYDETNDGDLSGDRLNPTVITLTPGNNTVTATSIAGDVEYLAVAIPDGQQIDAIILDAYTFDDGPVKERTRAAALDDTAFIAVQSGSVFTEPTSGTDVSNLLGYTHFGTALNQLGTDILDDMAGGSGAIGFIGSLQESQYTFWMQQTGSISTTYTLNIVVSELTPTALDAFEEPNNFATQIYIPLFGG